MKRLADYFRLCRASVRLGAASLIAVVVARLSLIVVPFRILRRWADGSPAIVASRDHADPSRRARIALGVAIASRLIPGATCLTQALAAQALLRLRGDWAKLCIGVTKGEFGEFKAHAWLEADGTIVIGDSPELDQYRQFEFASVTR